MSKVATYVQEGKFIDIVVSANVAAGDVVMVGDVAAVADRAITSGGTGAVHTEGVYSLVAGGSIGVGDKVTFNSSNGKVAAYVSGTSNPVIGTAITPAVENGGVMILLNK